MSASRYSRTMKAAGLALLLCGVAPAALAQQAQSTASTQPTGISQEQLLALVGRLTSPRILAAWDSGGDGGY